MDYLKILAIADIDDSYTLLENCGDYNNDYAGYAVCIANDDIEALSQACSQADNTITQENLATALKRGFVSVCLDQICKALQSTSLTEYLIEVNGSFRPESLQQDISSSMEADFSLLDSMVSDTDIDLPAPEPQQSQPDDNDFMSLLDEDAQLMQLGETLDTIKNQIKELNEISQRNSEALHMLSTRETQSESVDYTDAFTGLRSDIMVLNQQISALANKEQETQEERTEEVDSYEKLTYELTKDVAHKLGVKVRDDSLVITEDEIVAFVERLNLLSPVSVKEVLLSALLQMKSRDERKLATKIATALLHELVVREIER